MSEPRTIKCSVCGTVNRAETVFCTHCTYNIHMKHPGVRIEPNAGKGRSTRDQEREQKRQPEPDKHDEVSTASFTCFRCSGSLRIRLSHSEVAYRCPKCRAEFRVTKASESPLVFVVVPDMSRFTSKASDTSTRRKREIPREVLAALSAFGLEEAATFEQVRSAYRELVKGYHPDKVAHLGSDLRRVAEAKTKEINSAYRILEIFYAA